MIKSIYIQNYAIIDKIELEFDHMLNIITGETGAGKSILIGAMSLLMGKRADSKVLFDKGKKCIIESVFTNLSKSVSQILIDNDLDDEDHLIIRREISSSGKSRAFVNDTPVNLRTLQSLSIYLADLNQQFELLEIQNTDFHLKMLDAIAENGKVLKSYKTHYQSFRDKKSRLKELIHISQAAIKERDFVAFQLKELHEAELIENEQKKLEAEQQKLSSTEDLNQLIKETNYLMRDDENNIIDNLSALSYKWEKYADLDAQIKTLVENFNEYIENLKELSAEVDAIGGNVSSDPNRLEELNSRMNVLFNLIRKHQVSDVNELIKIQEGLESQLSQFDNNESEAKELEQEIDELEKQLQTLAVTLRKQRKAKAPHLEQLINDKLVELAMPNAQVKMEITNKEEFDKSGMDHVEILFSPNKGSDFVSIKNTASGGEISRLMLCMKSSVADVLAMPSLIFDEIDTGVSGEVALKMGILLSALAKSHQLIVITHSPQVASKASKHFHIYKEETSDRTITRVKSLKKDERVVELAKMLSGDPPSNSAISNAEELIKIGSN